jgi:phosphoribosylanthranilate isomerase
VYSPRVKICGIKTLEIAECAIENGADSLGFVFFGRSPRAVDIATARGIISNLPPFVNKTGVFVDKGLTEILDTVSGAGIDTIQLLADTPMYGREFIENLTGNSPFPVIAAVRKEVIDGNTIGELMNMHYRGVSAWMIDMKDPSQYGGSGKQALWKEIKGETEAAYLKSRVIVAGGINSGNIRHLLEKMQPYGIDVSSGLERERGVKDKALIRKFMELLGDVVSEETGAELY